jgi:integrating conjugative element protein (TIGR03757 family)
MDKFAQSVVAMALMVLSLTLAYASTPLNAIEVVFNDQTPVSNVNLIQSSLQAQGVTVAFYNLDAPAQLGKALSQGLPANVELAKKIVQERLHQDGSAALNARYQNAYRALTQSLAYELDRFPTIVFNHGQAVVYGVTDLAVALQIFQRWQASQ